MQNLKEAFIPVEKDEDNQRLIPTIWRPVFIDIVNAFAKKDYLLKTCPSEVSAVSKETAGHIAQYIVDYGEVLIPLPDETWESSVCICMGSHWDVLVDLWTAGEGQSDLVLGARVSESNNSYIVEVEMIYVP